MLPTVLRRIEGNSMTFRECGDVLGTFHGYADSFSVVVVEPELIAVYKANNGAQGTCTVFFMPAPEDPDTWALLCREADKIIDRRYRHHAS